MAACLCFSLRRRKFWFSSIKLRPDAVRPHRSSRSELLVSDRGTSAFIPRRVIPFSVRYDLGFHKIEFPQSPEKNPMVDQRAYTCSVHAGHAGGSPTVVLIGQGSRPAQVCRHHTRQDPYLFSKACVLSWVCLLIPSVPCTPLTL